MLCLSLKVLLFTVHNNVITEAFNSTHMHARILRPFSPLAQGLAVPHTSFPHSSRSYASSLLNLRSLVSLSCMAITSFHLILGPSSSSHTLHLMQVHLSISSPSHWSSSFHNTYVMFQPSQPVPLHNIRHHLNNFNNFNC